MRYDVVKYIGPSYTTLLKLYNGGVGPTIRVKPGDTLIIERHNDLEGPLGHYGHNQYMLPNTTNVSLCIKQIKYESMDLHLLCLCVLTFSNLIY